MKEKEKSILFERKKSLVHETADSTSGNNKYLTKVNNRDVFSKYICE